MANVSIGRSRLPPDAIRWLATSGIIVTSDPVRDRMVVLTRAISAARRSIRRPMEGGEGFSKGTMTAKELSETQGRARIETLWCGGKYAHGAATAPRYRLICREGERQCPDPKGSRWGPGIPAPATACGWRCWCHA